MKLEKEQIIIFKELTAAQIRGTLRQSGLLQYFWMPVWWFIIFF